MSAPRETSNRIVRLCQQDWQTVADLAQQCGLRVITAQQQCARLLSEGHLERQRQEGSRAYEYRASGTEPPPPRPPKKRPTQTQRDRLQQLGAANRRLSSENGRLQARIERLERQVDTYRQELASSGSGRLVPRDRR